MGSLQWFEPNRKMHFLFCIKYFNRNPAEKGLYVTLEPQTCKNPSRCCTGCKLSDLPEWFIDYSVGIQRNEDEDFKVINTELGKAICTLFAFKGNIARRRWALICIRLYKRLVIKNLEVQLGFWAETNHRDGTLEDSIVRHPRGFEQLCGQG